MIKPVSITQLCGIIISGLLLLCSSNSCNKPNQLETPLTMLTGDWKLVATATDDNLNGRLDAEEIQAWPQANTELLKFNMDSTGNESKTYDNINTNYSFRWAFYNSFHEIERSYTSHDIIYSHLDLLTPTDLYLKTMDTVYWDSSSIASWKIYKKK